MLDIYPSHKKYLLVSPKISDLVNDFISTKGLFDEFTDFNSASNIYETEKEYVIEYNKPGIPQEKWDVEIIDGKINIKAENEIEEVDEDKEKKYYKRSYSNMKVNESYSIPEDIDQSQVSANYKDGILKVTLPKVKKEISSTKIKVD